MIDVLIAIAILLGSVVLFIGISYLNDHTDRPEGCDELIDEAACHACKNTQCLVKQKIELDDHDVAK